MRAASGARQRLEKWRREEEDPRAGFSLRAEFRLRSGVLREIRKRPATGVVGVKENRVFPNSRVPRKARKLRIGLPRQPNRAIFFENHVPREHLRCPRYAGETKTGRVNYTDAWDGAGDGRHRSGRETVRRASFPERSFHIRSFFLLLFRISVHLSRDLTSGCIDQFSFVPRKL